MNSERDSHLLARAAVHGALADPGRLAIVDSLSLADASPSELQSRTSMSSNLLSHHLRVLEEAGVVLRRRSEGDGRRAYIQLVPNILDRLSSGVTLRAPRVVFVCTQNSARSQLAEAMWRARSDIPSASAGTRPARKIHPEAVAAAERGGFVVPAQPPRRLDDVLSADDLLVVVCDNAHEELPAILRRLHWAIPDPVRIGGQLAFDATVADLSDRIDRLAPQLDREGA